ncbi:mpv17-like protein isoform X1 [Drosophila subpulchrella]|uniref:mpv17-like protein isoform X1 n=1 Tax=Drosophila subpulchrella TaxID=1486046 RepID=UPI0018A1987A|nr:mpv17-like protein isoform X1 [Drosophila subpulchrella]
MARLFSGVRTLFRRYPIVTNSAIYGSLYVGAEYSQQFVSKRWLAPADERGDIDYATIGRYAVMGTAVYAPTLFFWYKWLDRVFPGTTKIIIVKKLVLDQFVLTPYLLSVFYAGMSLMEGSEDTFLELREKFVPTFMRSCIFWLPAQVLNFSLVAPRFRVIYMGVCGLIWVNILCWTKRQSLPVTAKANATETTKTVASIRNSET